MGAKSSRCPIPPLPALCTPLQPVPPKGDICLTPKTASVAVLGNVQSCFGFAIVAFVIKTSPDFTR